MSREVDEKIVQMRFDNKDFEKNVQTSMSTIDKLKQKLNFSGATKGLDDISAASKRVDMSGLSSGVSTVSAKFSALQVVGATTLMDITRSAEAAARRFINAFTFEPVHTGFDEFELKMGSVQTIMASTGESLDKVNGYLDELNEYSDKTIYSFSDMTTNIGKFTNAGVKLEDAVAAIKGVSNEAAVSGANAEEASRAMYNFAQALSAGYVKLIDWKSIENANMATVEFKNELIKTALELGTIKKKGDQYITVTTNAKGAVSEAFDATHNFNDSLAHQWMTTDVLTKTLSKYADETTKIGKKAYASAQDVKTFSMMMDTLKEAAQSGWAQTWQLIIGDFNQGKKLWTDLANFFGGMIDNMSNARNRIVEMVMSNPIVQLGKKLKNVSKDAKETMGKINDLGKVVNKVIRGDFGNGQKRIDKLTKSGYNFAKVQDMVNEKLGNSVRHNKKAIEASAKGVKVNNESSYALENLSKEKLKDLGLTKDQIYYYGELQKESARTGKSMDEIIKSLSKQKSGRDLLIDSFKNLAAGFTPILKSVGEAWHEFFPEKNVIERANSIHGVLESINKSTKKFKKEMSGSSETVDKLRRTFKGLFAIVDMITTIFGGGFKIAFKVSKTILDHFNISLLDVTANVGDAVVALRDFLFNNDLIVKGVALLGSGVKMAGDGFKKLVESIKGIPKVQEFINKLKSINFKEIGQNIISGLKNGLKDGINTVPKMLMDLGVSLLNAIKSVLGIHSPSTEFFDVGSNIIAGLLNGIKDGASAVLDVLKQFGSTCIDVLGKINWGNVFAGGLSVGILLSVKKIVGVVDKFASLAEGLGKTLSGVGNVLNASAEHIGKILENTAKVVKNFSKVVKAQAFKMKAAGVKDLAISLTLLAASVYVLAQLDTGKLWGAIGAVTALAAIMVALAWAVGKMSDSSVSISKNGINIKGIKSTLIAIGIAVLLMAATVKIIGSMDPSEAKRGFLGLAGVVGAIVAVFFAFGKLTNGRQAANMDKVGKMMKKMALSIILMGIAVKLIGTINWSTMGKGAAFVGGFVIFVAALVAISKIGKQSVIDKMGKMLLSISASLLIMTIVVKRVGGLSVEAMLKGYAFMLIFIKFVASMVLISRIAGQGTMGEIGKMLLSVSISLLIMVGVVKLAGMLSLGDMAKGVIFVGLFTIFIKALVNILKVGPKQRIANVAATLFAASISVGIMAGISILLGMVSLPTLAKGVVAVSILGVILSGMIAATKKAQNCKGNLIAMTVAIGIMAAAVFALSFIKPESLAGAVIALGSLMLIFAKALTIANTARKGIADMVVMTVLVGILGVVLFALGSLPIQSTLGAAAGLSILLIAMSAALKILSTISSVSVLALAGIAVLTLVVAGLAGILYLVRDMNPESSVATAIAMSTLLLSMSASLVILGAVGAMGPAAFIGIGALAVLIVAVGALMLAIGALVKKIPAMEEFLDKGIVILGKIGYGIGNFFGNIIGGFSAGISSGLPKIGEDLAAFMTNVKPFTEGAKTIDSSSFSGIKALVEMIAMISGASIIEKVASWLTGGSSMETFSEQLESFGDAIVKFSRKVSGKIDEKAVVSAAYAGKMLAEMSNSIPTSGGIFSVFTGTTDMEAFGNDIASFGEAIVKFSKKVSGKDSINMKAVQAAANAGKIMTSMQENLVASGGVVQWFTGEKDLGEFSEQLSAFGEAIVKFSKKVSKKGAINQKAVQAAADAGKIMIAMQENIVPSGGVVQWFTGDKDLGKFGEQILTFGNAIINFSNELTENGGINNAAISTAALAGGMLATLQKNVMPSKGIIQYFLGEKNLSNFGLQIVYFGKAIVAFSNIVSQNGGINASAVTAAANAGKIMTALQSSIPEKRWMDGKVTLDDFGEDIASFGEGLADYGEELEGANLGQISASLTSASKLIDLTKSMKDLNVEGLNKAEGFPKIGAAMKSYSDSLGKIDAGSVSSSIDSAIKLVRLSTMLKNFKPGNVENFKKITSVGSVMSDYSGKVSGINSIKVLISVGVANKMVSLMAKMGSVNTEGVDNFKSAVESLGSINTTKLNRAFGSSSSKMVGMASKMIGALNTGLKNSQSSITSTFVTVVKNALSSNKTGFSSAGSDASAKFTSGMEGQKGVVESKASSIAAAAAKAVRSQYDAFYKAGAHLAKGLAKGIKDNSSKATSNAKDIADQVANAMGNGSGKGSGKGSSKGGKGGKNSSWLPKGMSYGSKDFGKQADKAAKNFVNQAKKNMKKSAKQFSTIIDSVDSSATQPSIRPVVDVSDIKTGIDAIDDMFSNSPIGLRTDVKTANMISENRQNGDTALLKAVKGFREDFASSNNGVQVDVQLNYSAGSDANEIANDIAINLRRALRRGI